VADQVPGQSPPFQGEDFMVGAADGIAGFGGGVLCVSVSAMTATPPPVRWLSPGFELSVSAPITATAPAVVSSSSSLLADTFFAFIEKIPTLAFRFPADYSQQEVADRLPKSPQRGFTGWPKVPYAPATLC
jgi:hypothetical protein